MNQTADLMDRIGSLPPLPHSAAALMQAVQDPEASARQLVEAIQYDPALTGELLRVCNSAYMGIGHRVTSLQEAIVCLGTGRLTQLALGVHSGPLLEREQHGYGLARGALWRHSVAVAIASSLTARRMGIENSSEAFTAGLLHDIGKVALNEFVAEQFADILEMVRTRHMDFLEAEHAVLGTSHVEVGERIANRWDLPEALVRCIRYHHEPEALDPPDPLVDAVYLANCICLMLGVGLGHDGLDYRADPALMRRHGLREQDLEVLGAETILELHRVEGLFQPNHAATPGEGNAPSSGSKETSHAS